MAEPNGEFMDPVDDCKWMPAREILARAGYRALPPALVDDSQLHGRLWELIYALAGRRIYLHDTNHLSDCEVYAWLHDFWLNEATADIPPEAEWNCRVSLSEPARKSDPSNWLRYYADEETRADWAFDFPEDSIPPHEDPPYDRDRFLPGPPDPRFGGDPDFPEDDETEDSDPLGLKQVDREIREEKLRQLSEAESVDGPSGALFDAEPWALLAEDDVAGGSLNPAAMIWERPINQLAKERVPLMPPDELTDETITAKLWELLHTLALRGFYVLHTDHLGDRELYAALWHHGLRDEAILPGRSQTSGWFHDFISREREEEARVWLRFYANEEERAQHAEDWPDSPLPAREKAPFRRDWRLPKGPF